MCIDQCYSKSRALGFLILPANSHAFSPKCYERKRRDQSHPSTNHNHLSFTPSIRVPQSWRSYIECRQCKRALIKAIGLAYLQSARFRLQQHQRFIITGCMSDQTGDVPWVMSGGNSLPLPDLNYQMQRKPTREFGGMQHRLVHNAFLCTLLIQMYTT